MLHGTREADVDDLLRNHKLVDLYRVVREAIRTSEPRYSIKNMEKFYLDEARGGEVKTAGDSIVIYERWRRLGDQQLLDDIADYNRFDCSSTLQCRDWLLGMRQPSAPWYVWAPEDDGKSGKADERSEAEARVAAMAEALLAGDEGRGALAPAPSRPARVPPAREQARLVGCVLAPGPAARGVAGGRRMPRGPRALPGHAAPPGKEVGDPHVPLPGSGLQAEAGRQTEAGGDVGAGGRGGVDRRGRAAHRAEAGSQPQPDRNGHRADPVRPGRRQGAARSRLPLRRGGARREHGPVLCGRLRAAPRPAIVLGSRDRHAGDSRRGGNAPGDDRGAARPRRQPPPGPGPAGRRQDVHVLAGDRSAPGEGLPRWHRVQRP